MPSMTCGVSEQRDRGFDLTYATISSSVMMPMITQPPLLLLSVYGEQCLTPRTAVLIRNNGRLFYSIGGGARFHLLIFEGSGRV